MEVIHSPFVSIREILQSHKKSIFLALIIKLLATFSFYYVYSYYYSEKETSDVQKYYGDAQIIYRQCTSMGPYFRILSGTQNESDETILRHTRFWYTEDDTSIIRDSRTVIRFNLLLLPFSRGQILWHYLLISMLSFSGMLAAFSVLISRGTRFLPAYISCFYLPSAIFWSSGVIKEGLLIFFLGWAIRHFHKLSGEFNYRNLLATFLLSLLILFSKFYVFPAFLLFVVSFFAFDYIIGHQSQRIKILFIVASSILVLMIIAKYLGSGLPSKIYEKQRAFVNLGTGGHFIKNLSSGDTLYVPYEHKPEKAGKYCILSQGGEIFEWKNLNKGKELSIHSLKRDTLMLLLSIKPSGSYFVVERLSPTWTGVLKSIPEAISNAIFRPYPSDIRGGLEFLAILEMLVLGGVITLRIVLKKHFNKPDLPWIAASLVFSLFILVVSGLTTPVAGALVRYRMPAIWVLAMALFAENKKADPIKRSA